MCLITFHLKAHPHYKLVMAANRDEFYERPTAAAHFWQDHPQILAGRDLFKYGTWLGITKQGRIAALTNYRNLDHMHDNKQSRGEIISDYLAANISAEVYIDKINKKKKDFNGFNLLIGDSDRLVYYNNIDGNAQLIQEGTHSLSNSFLNTPWPKVVDSRAKLNRYMAENKIVNPDDLFEILANDKLADNYLLPDTGIGLELERQLSPLFIRTPDYGTRSSTVLLITQSNEVTFIEKTFHNGIFKDMKNYSFNIGAPAT